MEELPSFLKVYKSPVGNLNHLTLMPGALGHDSFVSYSDRAL